MPSLSVIFPTSWQRHSSYLADIFSHKVFVEHLLGNIIELKVFSGLSLTYLCIYSYQCLVSSRKSYKDFARFYFE